MKRWHVVLMCIAAVLCIKALERTEEHREACMRMHSADVCDNPNYM